MVQLHRHCRQTGSTFTSLTSHIFCPFPTCTQHKSAEKPTGFSSVGATIRHLQDCHRPLLGEIPLTYRQQHGIHICQRCDPPRIFNNSNSLGAHHSKSHVSTREKPNFTLLTEKLYNNSPASHTYINHWEEGLKWLQEHDQEPPPPSEPPSSNASNSNLKNQLINSCKTS